MRQHTDCCAAERMHWSRLLVLATIRRNKYRCGMSRQLAAVLRFVFFVVVPRWVVVTAARTDEEFTDGRRSLRPSSTGGGTLLLKPRMKVVLAPAVATAVRAQGAAQQTEARVAHSLRPAAAAHRRGLRKG